MISAAFGQHPELSKEGISEIVLVVVRTPSHRHFDLAYYDQSYAKDRPWRTVHNHGIEVTHFMPLPDLPDE